jgi:dTDP-4-dehydrorhamnose 3,5-epimerase
MGIKVEEIGLGVKIITPDKFCDYRGYYSEIFSIRTLKENGIDFNVVQDNEAYCLKKGTVRGIHFQNNPKAQAKILRCTKGKVFDVAVDLRKDSRTYKKYVSVILEENDGKFIFIPKGFGHICVSLVDNSIINYKVNELYCPTLDRGIRFNDPEINILYPINDFVVSEKDKIAPLLKESDVNF